MQNTADQQPIHRPAPPRPAHRASLVLPGPDLAAAAADPGAFADCVAQHCSRNHADDSIARTAFGPLARWGRVRPEGSR